MHLSEKTLYQKYLMRHESKQNRGHKSRDSERLKCYRSEWAFQSAMTQKGMPVPTFATIKEAQRFAKKIYKSKTWPRLYAEAGQTDFMNMLGYASQKGHLTIYNIQNWEAKVVSFHANDDINF